MWSNGVDGIMEALHGINTWTDWHLIPSSRPVFSVPSFKSNYIDIPGANGSVDASTLLGDHPTYNNREGSVEFYVMNGYGEWYNRYSEILERVHGRKVKVVLEDDPGYFYEGRMTVNQWKSEKDWSKITLDYHLDPFKYELTTSIEPWLWDPFNFIYGIIRPCYSICDNSTGDVISTVFEPLSNIRLADDTNTTRRITIPITASAMPIVPKITYKSNTSPGEGNQLQLAKYVGSTGIVNHYITPEDTNTHTVSFYDMKFQNEEANLIIIAFEGTSYDITIDYRGGRL